MRRHWGEKREAAGAQALLQGTKQQDLISADIKNQPTPRAGHAPGPQQHPFMAQDQQRLGMRAAPCTAEGNREDATGA